MSTIVKVTPPAGDAEALILKVLGSNYKLREDPSTLVTVMRVAAAGGLAAPVLAEFTNGVVYDYTQGELINPDNYPHDAHIQRLAVYSSSCNIIYYYLISIVLEY